MNEETLKKYIIDVVEYGIWDIGEDHGKIKRWAIDKLSKMADDIPPNAALTSTIHSDAQKQCPSCVDADLVDIPTCPKCGYFERR